MIKLIGDVVFFKKTNSFISKIIANITNSEFTHVGLIVDYDKETGLATIIESNRFIETRLTEVKLDKNHVVFTTGNKPDNMTKCIVDFAYKKIGTKYDYFQILGLLLSLLFKGDRNSYFNSTNKFLCSELIDLAYFKAGVKRNSLQNIGNITPQELLQYYNLIEYVEEG